MKSIISILVSLSILVTLGLFENFYIHKIFTAYELEIDQFIEKCENEELTVEDVVLSESKWTDLKETLHLIIPHNDIKPFNEIYSELKISVKYGDYFNARKELQVLHDCIKTIPLTYKFTIQNIF